MFVTVNECDAHVALSQTWYSHKSASGKIYAKRKQYLHDPKRCTHIYLHSLILHKGNGFIDHINRDTLDNRRSNLRIATLAQNCANRHSPKQKRFKGTKYKQGLWQSVISQGSGRGSRSLGYYKTEEEAAAAYNKAAIERWGEFACLNKIES
jgi:hypothetical protein